MEERGPQITEHDLAAFEKRLGHSLVEDYREFLLVVNGGSLDAANAEFSQVILNQLFSLNEPNDIGNLEARQKYVGDFPSRDLLMIGDADGGSSLLLGVVGPHRGEVWFQDRVDPRPDGSNPRVEWFKRRDMTKLANSFREFMASLGPIDVQ